MFLPPIFGESGKYCDSCTYLSPDLLRLVDQCWVRDGFAHFQLVLLVCLLLRRGHGALSNTKYTDERDTIKVGNQVQRTSPYAKIIQCSCYRYLRRREVAAPPIRLPSRPWNRSPIRYPRRCLQACSRTLRSIAPSGHPSSRAWET